jgi:hypothetical protein
MHFSYLPRAQSNARGTNISSPWVLPYPRFRIDPIVSAFAARGENVESGAERCQSGSCTPLGSRPRTTSRRQAPSSSIGRQSDNPLFCGNLNQSTSSLDRQGHFGPPYVRASLTHLRDGADRRPRDAEATSTAPRLEWAIGVEKLRPGVRMSPSGPFVRLAPL